MGHIKNFYEANPDIPLNRKPNIIHVAGKCVLFKPKNLHRPDVNPNLFKDGVLSLFPYICVNHEPDVVAIAITVDGLQQHSMVASSLYFDYNYIVLKTFGFDSPEEEQSSE